LRQQALAQMRAEKAGSAGHQHPGLKMHRCPPFAPSRFPRQHHGRGAKDTPANKSPHRLAVLGVLTPLRSGVKRGARL
jgi:hypothetical protein